MINRLVLGFFQRHRSLIANRKECGATMAEYAFLLGLIALVALAAVQGFGIGVRALYERVPTIL